MKIGIDAKWLFDGHISGRLFIQNVLPELIALHPEIEWHIFLDKKNKRFELPIKEQNITVHYVWAGFNMLSNLFVLPRYAKRLNLDAVLFQTFAPKGTSFKSIVFIHDVLFRNYPQYFTWTEKIYFSPLKWTVPLADRILTTTEFVKNELVKHKYSKDQLVDLAPSGVTKIFKPQSQCDKEFLMKTRQKFDLPDSYLLYVGRLNERKNIHGLINAMTLLKNNIPLVVVGEKDWKLPPKKDMQPYEFLKSQIHFLGNVTDEELACIYASATVFCFPSFAEGFGLPPLEAMAAGIPVIVSNTTAMPEVCSEFALFVDPHSSKDIAEKINWVLSNGNYCQQRITEGVKWSGQYTWKRTAEGIMKSIFSAVETGKN